MEDSAYMALEGIGYATTYVLGAILVLMTIDLRLAAPMAAWLLIYIWFVKRVATRVARASERMSETKFMVTGRIVDAYANIETVKLFAHGKREEKYALSTMKRQRLRFLRVLRLMTRLTFSLATLNGFLMIGVIGPAIWLWSLGIVSVGEVAAAAALTIRLNGMTGWIMWVTVRLFEHAGVMREGLQSIAVPYAVTDAQNAPELTLSAGEIRFERLTHHYGKGAGGLDNVSLTIRAGEKVGLVGRSGSGKSSLVNLLLRFRNAEGGQILIDGQPVSAVTQDSSLLHRSVRANILYGRPDAAEADMVLVAKRAEAHGFYSRIERSYGNRGYEAQVGERGVKLLGGQSHRTAIVQMDRIVVLDAGRVAEQGTHKELLAKNGLYGGFWNRQSGGFIGVEADAVG